ncbi:hypothetical protein [Devosia crocina]|uniref:hypothetical protein n=1 Tax=Devosia crocina TaxID=429728 RepID=UPI001113AA4C|nr:hypothetical protein [Devosia crocina]
MTQASGTSGHTLLKDLSPDQRAAFLAAQQRHEGWRQGDVYNEAGIRLPPSEIPNIVASELDTSPSIGRRVQQMLDSLPPIPRDRIEGTAARTQATFNAPRPIAKPGSIAAQQAARDAPPVPAPVSDAAIARSRAADFSGQKRSLPIIGRTGESSPRDPVGAMPSAAELRAFNRQPSTAPNVPSGGLVGQDRAGPPKPPATQTTRPASFAADDRAGPVTRSTPTVQPAADLALTQERPGLTPRLSDSGRVMSNMPGSSSFVGAEAGPRAVTPKSSQSQPTAAPLESKSRLLPSIGPSGRERFDDPGSMPRPIELTALRQQQPGQSGMVGQERVAPTQKPATTPPGSITRIQAEDRATMAGNSQMTPGARPEAADSLVKQAEDARRQQERDTARQQLVSNGMSYAGQERAVGITNPKPATSNTPQGSTKPGNTKPTSSSSGAATGLQRMDSVGSMPQRDEFNQAMGLPSSTQTGAKPQVGKPQSSTKPISQRVNDVLDATQKPAQAQSPADVPKYITTTERVPITRPGGQSPVKPSTQFTDGSIPLGETRHMYGRDSVAQAEAGRLAAEQMQFKVVQRTTLNPEWVEQQAPKPQKKTAQPRPVEAPKPQKQDPVEREPNLLERARMAVGLPAGGLGQGIGDGLRQGLGNMFGLTRSSGPKPPVGTVLGTAANGGQMIQGHNGVKNSTTQSSHHWLRMTGEASGPSNDGTAQSIAS